MGHSLAGVEDAVTTFTVTKSNPSGNVVRFTVTAGMYLLTTTRNIRQVLCDAIEQFIAAERADLTANGDGAIIGADLRYIGDGFPNVSFNFGGKYAEVTLTAKTNIAVTGDITVATPFADCV